jgi:23S rRNA G2445 N2-methylase RlmL
MIIDQLRLVGSPQTNKVMHAEMIRVAVRAAARRPPEPKKEGTGSLVYPFDPALAAAALIYLRTPTRVVWDLFRVETTRLEPLYDGLRADVAGDDRGWAPPSASLSVEVRRVGDFAAGERQIIGTVKNALIDGAGDRGRALRLDPDRPDLRFVARMDDGGGLVVSLDLGGGSLSQRGWRVEHGEAPLREHLAAVLCMLGRFDPRVDLLVDPMCGSGTIPIEAALMARGAPRDVRPIDLPCPALAPHWPADAPSALFADAAPIIVGNELDLEALVAARQNAARANTGDAVVWRRGDFRGLTPGELAAIAEEQGRASERGLVLSNPPYGERLDTVDLRVLYGELADWVRGLGAGWRAGFLVDNPDFEPTFERAFRARARIKKPLANGPLRAYFYLYE